MTLQSVGVAVKNDNEIFFVPLRLRAGNGLNSSAQGVSGLSKMSVFFCWNYCKSA